MAKRITGEDVVKRLGGLAAGRCNDAVKLVFAEAPGESFIDGLDLSLLSEVKRGANGVIEVKLLNRIEALELLSGLVGAPSEAEGAQGFFKALDEAAKLSAERG